MPEKYEDVSILLFEDDDIDAYGIKRCLKKHQLNNPFYRVRDGVEGLELMRSQTIKKPLLILLDLNMPRMNGHETLKEIRNDPELTESVVFVLTTSNAEEDKTAAYRQHIAGYIVKSRLDLDFEGIFQFLEHYWEMVDLPCEH